MKMIAKYLIFVILAGVAWAQTEPNFDDLPPELKDRVNKEDYDKAVDKFGTALKEKCEKNGAGDAYSSFMNQRDVLVKCVQSSLNITDPKLLMDEVEKAKPTGTVDEVFKKYCARTPGVKACVRNALDALKPCLDEDEKKSLNVIHNVTLQLADFVCFKEGDRIALFISEGGPECYQNQSEAIQNCINSTFSDDVKDLNTTDITANKVPEFTFDAKRCGQIVDLQKCVVKALEACETPASANIVESLFKFARKATPCKDPEASSPKARSHKANENAPGAAAGITLKSATLFAAVAVALSL